MGVEAATEAIPVSFGEEAGDATPTVTSPTVSDLLPALLDTLDAARSSEAVTVEEVGPSRRPEEPVE